MDTTASDTLIRTHLDFLRRHAPFDRMEPDALRFLGERLSTAFYPAESEILVPEDGPPRFFYIVYRGKVQARQTGAVSVTEYSTPPWAPAKASRSVPSLPGGRPPTATWRSRTPTASSSRRPTSCASRSSARASRSSAPATSRA